MNLSITLTCGHQSPPLEPAHPVWDDPSTPIHCEGCHLERQINLEAQLQLYATINSPE